MVSPGKVYRNEALDATHLPVFYQIEGLAVDEGLTMADLRGAIQAFVDALFGAGLRTRLRPDYFPFTEPSADVSMECHVCRGESDQAGRRPVPGLPVEGWIEIAGCGMVNPRVLVACGIDPDRYSGFAFGLGIERALMLATASTRSATPTTATCGSAGHSGWRSERCECQFPGCGSTRPSPSRTTRWRSAAG